MVADELMTVRCALIASVEIEYIYPVYLIILLCVASTAD